MLKFVVIFLWTLVTFCDGRDSCSVLIQPSTSDDRSGQIEYPSSSVVPLKNSVDCDVLIEGPAQAINVSFSHLQLPCKSGGLIVWSRDGHRLHTFCGTNLPHPYEFRRSSVRIQLQFHNNSGVAFALKYKYIRGNDSQGRKAASCRRRMLHDKKSADERSGEIVLANGFSANDTAESCPFVIKGKTTDKNKGVLLVIDELSLGSAGDCKGSALIIQRHQTDQPELLCGQIFRASRLYSDGLTVRVRVSADDDEPRLKLRYVIMSEDITTEMANAQELRICGHGPCNVLHHRKARSAAAERPDQVSELSEPGCGGWVKPIPSVSDAPRSKGPFAGHGTWPWIGSLHRKSPFMPFCGVSLINEEWMLTTAHCLRRAVQRHVTPSDYSNIGVTLGTHSLRGSATLSPTEQRFDVVKVVMHPSYDPIASKNEDNDIALIKLSSKAIYNDAVKPICLPSRSLELPRGTYSAIAGWGEDFNAETLDWAQLQYVWVPTIDHKKCRETYGRQLTDNMLCAGYESGGIDSCQGDGGGPMIMPLKSGAYVQVGIISWGDGCGVPGRPGVYTKVNNYIDWIRDVIKNE